MADEDFDPFEDEETVEAESPSVTAEPAKAEETPAATVAEAEPAASQGEQADATPASIEATEEPEPQTVPITAFLEVKRQGQELKRQLQAFEDEQRRRQAPDPDEDPEGYQRWVQAEMTENAIQGRIDMSINVMREAYDDFGQMEDVFNRLVRDEQGNVVDTGLLMQFANAPNPAKFAYDKAKEHLEIQALRDPTVQAAKREQMKAELMKEVLAELKAAQAIGSDAPSGLSATDMPSLAQVASAGANTVQREKSIQEVTLADVFDDEPKY